MKTEKANATNNFIVRIWSLKHYGGKLNTKKNMYRGVITDTTSKKSKFFNGPAKLLMILELMYKNAEKKK